MLASFSYHYWIAGETNRKLRLQLNEPGFLRVFWFAMILICIGLAGTSQRMWEIVLWGVLALFSLINVIRLQR